MSPPRRKRQGRSAQPARKSAKKAAAPPRRARASGEARRELAAMLDRLDRSGAQPDGAAIRRLRRLLDEAIAEAPDGHDEGHVAEDGWDADERGGRDPEDEDDWDDPDEEDEEDEEDEDWEDPAWDPWASRRRWQRFEAPAKPIPVEGGLTARSQRGAIGESWWSKRFLAAIEAVMEGGRSTRGRSYARKGQVIDLSVGAGLVEAHVQGSRGTPYRVRLILPAVPDECWDQIVAALAAEAGYAARLLAGDLPHEMEEVFAAEGTSLFPSPTARLTTECSCPDWANPCKHIAAVCYLLAESFDRDPFAVLAWRGRTREQLLDRLRTLRGAGADEPGSTATLDTGLAIGDAGLATDGTGLATADTAPPPVTAPPLVECLVGFWKAGPELAGVRVRPEATAIPGAVLRHLTPGLLEVAGRDVGELLEPAYADLAAAAARRALAIGEPPLRAARTSPRPSSRRSTGWIR